MKKLSLLSAILFTLCVPGLSMDKQEKSHPACSVLKLGAKAFIAYLCFKPATDNLWHGGQGIVDRFNGDTHIECETAFTPFAFRCYDRVYGNNYGAPIDMVPVSLAFGALTSCICGAAIISCKTQVNDLIDYFEQEQENKEN